MLFLQSSCMLMGGSMPRPLTGEVKMKAAAVLRAATGDKLTSGSEQPELVYYATQVVAGTNYYMVYELKTNDKTEYYCVRAYESLPYAGSQISSEGFLKSDTLAAACTNCKTFGEAETICQNKSAGLTDSSL